MGRRILIAIDDSEAAMRAVRYVADLLGGREDVDISLLHVLSPLPPELLETGGAGDAESEARIEAEQEEEQRRWIEAARKAKAPLFQKARALLHEAGFAPTAVREHAFETVPEERVHHRILDAAEACGCDTIVLGRDPRGWMAQLLNRYVSHDVVKHAAGRAVWVIG